MKRKINRLKVSNKYFLNFLIIIPFILIITIIVLFSIKYNKDSCNIQINYDLDEKNNPLKHNYILFLDKNNKSHGKLVETNGWLLLEAVLEKSLYGNINQDLTKAIELFSNDSLIGWWPEEIMQKGKSYFLNNDSVKLYYDSDDTAWIYRIHGNFIPENILKTFLSDEPLPYPFDEVCLEINCNRQYIVRVWSNIDWHDDIDIIGIANFITQMDLNSKELEKVFETNKNLINFIISNRDLDSYFKYYEPKVTGYFLLLFYDEQGQTFLTNKSKYILLQKLNRSFHELNTYTLISRWGGGEDRFYGCNIVTVNERIPKLMQEYAKRHLDI